jgi:O-antigen biosynthesis protein WbqP
MLNRFFAFILIITLSPLFIIVALFVIIEDGFPIFFTQKRIGIKLTFFKIYKFRSMKKNTPNVATHLLINPERYLLQIGNFIRKTSLDELPNLINIVKGEMVFVGPRPALYNQDDLMSLRVAKGVDKLKPGITGWAQINGRDDISIEKKVQLEEEYLHKKSFLFDLKIIIKTFTNVLFRKGVSH